MAITAATDALTDVATAQTYLKLAGSNETQELKDKLQLLINSYSRAIHRYTGRQFLPVETAKGKAFYYDGNGYLVLSGTELQGAPTSVVLHTDMPTASWRTLQNGTSTIEREYRLEPRNGTAEGTFLSIALPDLLRMPTGLALYRSPDRKNRGFEVTVTGKWGAGVVPADVQHALLIAVANARENPEGFATRSLGPMSFTESDVQQIALDETGLSLPRDSRALLAPYKRRSVG